MLILNAINFKNSDKFLDRYFGSHFHRYPKFAAFLQDAQLVTCLKKKMFEEKDNFYNCYFSSIGHPTHTNSYIYQ